MRNINLFVEDVAHEDFLIALIQRLANEYNVEINIKTSSVRGGRGTVIRFRQFDKFDYILLYCTFSI